MYEGRDAHIVRAITEVSEKTRLAASGDLKSFSTAELEKIVWACAQERFAIADRDMIIELAMAPFVQELRDRGVLSMKIARLMRRNGEQPNTAVVTRILAKWRELCAEVEALESGKEIHNRKYARILSVVRHAVEQNKRLASDTTRPAEVRHRARHRQQLIDTWYQRVFHKVSGAVLAVPAMFTGNNAAASSAVGASGAAVGGTAMAVSGTGVVAGAAGASVLTKAGVGAVAALITGGVVVVNAPKDNPQIPPQDQIVVAYQTPTPTPTPRKKSDSNGHSTPEDLVSPERSTSTQTPTQSATSDRVENSQPDQIKAVSTHAVTHAASPAAVVHAQITPSTQVTKGQQQRVRTSAEPTPTMTTVVAATPEPTGVSDTPTPTPPIATETTITPTPTPSISLTTPEEHPPAPGDRPADEVTGGPLPVDTPNPSVTPEPAVTPSQDQSIVEMLLTVIFGSESIQSE